jgi:hypothetical protein
MKLHGQSTLSAAEKLTEARQYVNILFPQTHKMQMGEARFVERIANRMKQYGDKALIGNDELSRLRDLNAEY